MNQSRKLKKFIQLAPRWSVKFFQTESGRHGPNGHILYIGKPIPIFEFDARRIDFPSILYFLAGLVTLGRLRCACYYPFRFSFRQRQSNASKALDV